MMRKILENDRDIAVLLGKVLRYGVVSASLIALIGGLLYLGESGSLAPDYEMFKGAPEPLRHLPGIFSGVASFDGASIIQLSVVVLISTPIIRVVFSAFGFAMEKDYLYVLITFIVLCVILYGMIGGLA